MTPYARAILDEALRAEKRRERAGGLFMLKLAVAVLGYAIAMAVWWTCPL